METHISDVYLVSVIQDGLPADDSVHGGNGGSGRELLDNITPNALGGGGNSGGEQWSDYSHLKDRSLDTGWVVINAPGLYDNGYRYRGMGMVDGSGTPSVRCIMEYNGKVLDTAWIVGEACVAGSAWSIKTIMSPRGLNMLGSGAYKSMPW